VIIELLMNRMLVRKEKAYCVLVIHVVGFASVMPDAAQKEMLVIAFGKCIQESGFVFCQLLNVGIYMFQ
jgi:hypothetical protein